MRVENELRKDEMIRLSNILSIPLVGVPKRRNVALFENPNGLGNSIVFWQEENQEDLIEKIAKDCTLREAMRTLYVEKIENIERFDGISNSMIAAFIEAMYLYYKMDIHPKNPYLFSKHAIYKLYMYVSDGVMPPYFTPTFFSILRDEYYASLEGPKNQDSFEKIYQKVLRNPFLGMQLSVYED